MKRLGFEMVDSGSITFCHKAKDINVDIRINGPFKCNVLAFGQYLIECDLNLCTMNQYKKE